MSTKALPPPSARPSPSWGRWVALGAAPAAWTGQEWLGWFIGARVCAPLTVRDARLLVALVTLCALGIAVAGAVAGYRMWRPASTHMGLQYVEGIDRDEFLAVGGFAIAVVLSLGIVWAGISSLLSLACEGI